ncbi:MAG TPA: type II toxin-antitoxin system VapC family toxin [Thermoanaerobaculia bacterium]|nr:type II toxin-antitoxin system VapC family toxin [Thermoanaerobaculia bacterium]
MRKRVYLETTVISYLTARPSRTLVGAAHQQLTIDWWEQRRHDFDLVVSELVLREAQAGDPDAAKRRLTILEGIPRLALSDEAIALAQEFIQNGLLPLKAADDGLHIAVATTFSVDYLLTWNCTHIANPELQAKLAEFLQQRGLFLPFICTPEELLGGQDREL